MAPDACLLPASVNSERGYVAQGGRGESNNDRELDWKVRGGIVCDVTAVLVARHKGGGQEEVFGP